MSRTIPIAFLVLTISSAASVRAQSTADTERLVTRFFAAYNEFDGSHLEYYDENVELEDDTAGQTLRSRAAVEELYRQSVESYEEVEFQIADRLIDGRGEQVAVRGRLVGRALGRDFDVPFATFLRLRAGKIVRQVDFVDYAALRAQVQPSDGQP